MRSRLQNGRTRVTIDPGEYYVSKKPEVISTLLGSCVSACLWDPVAHVFGMNHFLLANQRYPMNQSLIKSDSGRYGINSMELLINGLLKAGASRSRLRAKAFGGANVLKQRGMGSAVFPIGDVNSRFIVEFLENEGIPLVASHLGSNHGRVIYFDGLDFSVYMKRIKTSEEQQVLVAEDRLFNSALAEQSREERDRKGHIEIW